MRRRTLLGLAGALPVTLSTAALAQAPGWPTQPSPGGFALIVPVPSSNHRTPLYSPASVKNASS